MMERRQQVEELFHAALERQPSERDTFLSQACRTDPELRAEVESLISAHEQPGSFLDSLTYDTETVESASPALVGESIGRYLILSKIGGGGMGDVYLARDTQLDRKLALKLLPERYTADEIRVRRFILEARAASSLNHPNIITIHEIGHFGSVHFIATEFVEGERLRDQISRGPIAVADALDIAAQIASALSAAHAAGIVHRDIKPENIMVRPDRYVKVLDFGLAKLTERPKLPGFSEASTAVGIDTDPGTVMGTQRYMSPEQARGLEVDARSDIFNLGIVLYEMLVGVVPFSGDTPADIVASILRTEPTPLADYGVVSPADLQRIVSKALNKVKESRYQTTEEILADLRAVEERLQFEEKLNYSGKMPAIDSIPGPGSRRALPPMAALLIVLTVVTAVLLVRYWPSRTGDTNQYSSDRPLHSVPIVNWRNVPGESRSDPKFSPDGSEIAYSLIEPGNPETILVKPVGGRGNAVPVQTDGSSCYSPIWSPDGQQIAFVSQTGTHTRIGAVPSHGGAPTWFKELDGGEPVLKYWSQNGPAIFYELKNNLYALNLSSNEISQLTGTDPSSTAARYFSLSPKEDLIAYREVKDGKFDLWVMPVGAGSPTRITDDAPDDKTPYWLPDGERLVYASGREGAYQLCIGYVDGREPMPLPLSGGGYEISDISRDGSKILLTDAQEVSNIMGVKTDTGEEFEVTSNLDVDLWPDVAPDGKTLTFQTAARSNALRQLVHSTIMLRPVAGTGPDVQLISDGWNPKWVPDGGRLSFLRVSDSDGLTNIWTAGISGGDEVQLTTGGVLATGYTQMPYSRIQDGDPAWSSDGAKVLYCSDRSGIANVWMTSTDGTGEKNVSDNTVAGRRFSCPFWSPDNSAIAYVAVFPPSGETKRTWRVYVKKEQEPARSVVESLSYIRLLGWSHSGDEVYIASIEGATRTPATAADVDVFRVSASGDGRKPVALLKSTYPFAIQLSRDGSQIAFVSRQQRKDDIWLVPGAGGEERKLTGNNNPGLYYSSPAWSPDGQSIYYGRQEKRTLVFMIDNVQHR